MASKLPRLQLADMQTVDRLAMRPLQRLTRRMALDILRAFKTGNDIVQVMIEHRPALVAQAVDVMVAAHLMGRRRMDIVISKHDSSIKASAFDGALAFLRRRLNLTTSDFVGLRNLYGAESTRVVNHALLWQEQKVQAAIAEAIRDGVHVREGVSRVRSAMESVGLSDKPHVYETIFRTQTALAYSAGEANAMDDPDVRDIIWGYEYTTVGDDRVRPEHEALEGFTAAKDDPIWNQINPPNGWNCRCNRIPIFVDDPAAMRKTKRLPEVATVDGKQIVPGADPGWGFNPGDVFRDMIQVN